MISKNISFSLKPNLLTKFSNNFKQLFSTHIPVQNIRNSNLKFDTEDWIIHLYPFYPQIIKKRDRNAYEINSNSAVLAFIFLNKNIDNNSQWETRKSISFKFKQLGQILSAQIRCGNQVVVETQGSKENADWKKIFIIKDLKNEHKMSISLLQKYQNERNSSLSKLQTDSPAYRDSLSTKMSYAEYLIMYKIIQNSLLDLSGWRFMMQIQKRNQLGKIDSKIIQDKEVSQLLKNN